MAKKKYNKDRWLIRVLIILFIAILFLLIISNKNFSLNDEEKCEGENGVWVTSELSQKSFCNYKTSDFGVSCNDISKCEGTCLANILNSKLGACSEFKIIFGCQKELINGNVEFICHD